MKINIYFHENKLAHDLNKFKICCFLRFNGQQN